MNTCGTCKFFGEAIEQYDEETFENVVTRFHTCSRIIKKDNFVPSSNLSTSTEIALAEDCSGLHAALLTTESFGCVLWEEKVE
ncbi:MAG: hypothetical protein E6R03_18255 [Hyphomicrobiaceae bacterium]|nr:MAG: hypothetical protein E6R03_18255 [Hyphomicrobiaceae bacterium]